MDYNKLLKQELIELLEKRSFSDLIYKEETQLRKLLLSQISDKCDEIKVLTAESKKLKDLHIDKEVDFSNTLDNVRQHYIANIEEKQTIINDVDSKLIHFFAQCQDDDSKDLLFNLLSNQNLKSKDSVCLDENEDEDEDEDSLDDIDLDFDDIDLDGEDLDDDLIEDLDLDFEGIVEEVIEQYAKENPEKNSFVSRLLERNK
ncbi:hypothetical protein AB4264_24170 [Vibrio sp. 10N.261.55.B8]|uniref:hypothetical protein n=1 Tax=unclassified Vibrio TaxID=2614977 RepID=UPI003551532A